MKRAHTALHKLITIPAPLPLALDRSDSYVVLSASTLGRRPFQAAFHAFRCKAEE